MTFWCVWDDIKAGFSFSDFEKKKKKKFLCLAKRKKLHPSCSSTHVFWLDRFTKGFFLSDLVLGHFVTEIGNFFFFRWLFLPPLEGNLSGRGYVDKVFGDSKVFPSRRERKKKSLSPQDRHLLSIHLFSHIQITPFFWPSDNLFSQNDFFSFFFWFSQKDLQGW